MFEVVIPTNTSWNEIFQYYTGEDIQLEDIISYLKTLSNKRIHRQSGGQIGWIREAAEAGRLVRLAVDVAPAAAEGAAAGGAAGAVGGPVGAVAGAIVGAVGRAVVQRVVIEGAAAIIAIPAGPAAPVVQRTIVTGIGALFLAYGAYTAWSTRQGVEGLIGGGHQQDMVSSYLSEMKPMMDEIEPVMRELKRLGGEEKFKAYLENITEAVILSKKQPPMRVFSVEDIFVAIAFTHLYTHPSKTTRKNITHKKSKRMGSNRRIF